MYVYMYIVPSTIVKLNEGNTNSNNFYLSDIPFSKFWR
jgi:hypothetical protein